MKRDYLSDMNFNPRLREGGDEIQRLGLRCLWISIHASAREATFPNQSLAPCIQFQSTPPRGRRHKCISNLHGQFYFNPRLREGGDVPGVDRNSSVFDFNPRLREGGDEDGMEVYLSEIHISIHASAREATLSRRQIWKSWKISIHASAREATAITKCSTPISGFQSTPPRGRRPYSMRNCISLTLFQSTPPRGRRPH